MKLVVVVEGEVVAKVVLVVLGTDGDGWVCPQRVGNLVCLDVLGLVPVVVPVEGTLVTCMCAQMWVGLCSQMCL